MAGMKIFAKWDCGLESAAARGRKAAAPRAGSGKIDSVGLPGTGGLSREHVVHVILRGFPSGTLQA